MPLDPQVEKLLADIASAGIPQIHEQRPEQARNQMLLGNAALGAPQAVASVQDRTIPVTGAEIPIRVYKPRDEALPVVVYFHGGGWVIGSIETHDGYCRALANAANVIVVSVDYRLAPEFQFPTAAEDCYDATKWVCDNLAAIGGAGHVAVAGDSAGGNLAAVAALMARDRGGPEIAFQFLIYPITDCDFDTRSYLDFAEDHYLTRESMIWFWDHYCSPNEARTNPYVSPLRAADLSNLPPARVITAEFDPLRDEGEVYAKEMSQAGVSVELKRYDGMIHGFTRRFNQFAAGQVALDEAARALRAVLNQAF